VSGWDTATGFLNVARATLRTILRSRLELRVLRLFFDLRFDAAKVVADLRDSAEFGKAKFAFSREAGRQPVLRRTRNYARPM